MLKGTFCSERVVTTYGLDDYGTYGELECCFLLVACILIDTDLYIQIILNEFSTSTQTDKCDNNLPY